MPPNEHDTDIQPHHEPHETADRETPTSTQRSAGTHPAPEQQAPTGAHSQVVVIGAGVAGLASALALSRQGHRVTIIERDATPTPTSADEAFWWDRRGAPQVRHSHALLARLRNLLRDRYPDVLQRLLAAGATEIRFCEMMPPEIDDPSPRPGDEDLVALACRRTTFEWVLRSVVLADPAVTLLDGATVTGLTVESGSSGPPVVTGVRVRLRTNESDAGRDGDRTTDDRGNGDRTTDDRGNDDRTTDDRNNDDRTTDDRGNDDQTSADGHDGQVTIPAEFVVATTGRRSGVSSWLAAHGVELQVTEEDTGIIYLSRFYRLLDGVEPPPQDGPIGADLGYLKYAIFQGDNRTHSITFAVRTSDEELRRRLLDPDTFNRAASLLPATAPWADPSVAEPITPVHVMGGLLNRLIRFVDESGEPVVLGLHAVGDAHTCTNPLYGRGCTLAMVQANLLADAVAAHPRDPRARALAFEQACATEIEPWYHAAVTQDRIARDLARRERARSEAAHDELTGGDGPAQNPDDTQPGQEADDPTQMMAEIMREGLLPAVRRDATVFRAFLRAFNLLDRPDALLTDQDVMSRVLAVYNDRENRPPEPVLGPPRTEMLAALAA